MFTGVAFQPGQFSLRRRHWKVLLAELKGRKTTTDCSKWKIWNFFAGKLKIAAKFGSCAPAALLAHQWNRSPLFRPVSVVLSQALFINYIQKYGVNLYKRPKGVSIFFIDFNYEEKGHYRSMFSRFDRRQKKGHRNLVKLFLSFKMLVQSAKKRSISNEMLPEPVILKRKLGQRKNFLLRWGLNSRPPAQNRIGMTTSFRYNRNKSLPVTGQNDWQMKQDSTVLAAARTAGSPTVCKDRESNGTKTQRNRSRNHNEDK